MRVCVCVCVCVFVSVYDFTIVCVVLKRLSFLLFCFQLLRSELQCRRETNCKQ